MKIKECYQTEIDNRKRRLNMWKKKKLDVTI